MCLLTAPADEYHWSSLSASILPTLFQKEILIIVAWHCLNFTIGFFPASLPPNSNDAVIYITIHIFQGIKSQWNTCVPGDVLRWNLTKMNTWNAELKQKSGQGRKPDESTCSFSESEEFCLFWEWEREIRRKKQGSCFSAWYEYIFKVLQLDLCLDMTDKV